MTSDRPFATIGDNCIDRYLPPVGLTTVGGNAVNVAVQLASLGRRVAYHGAIGADAEGGRILSALAGNGVETRVETRPGERTAVTDLELLHANDRRIVREDFGACASYRPSESALKAIRRSGHLHIGWLTDAAGLKRRLAGSGVVISQDLAVNPDPAAVTLAFASSGESWDRAEAMLSDILEKGIQVGVVTCGALGSLVGTGRTRFLTYAAPAVIVDTTGAGDSFIAGFLHAFAQNRPLDECLFGGRDVAARTCGHYGGFPQEPHRWPEP
jgi:fructoselysine 6-kinase